nr:sugar transferase [Mesorhizobium xinjiangense]
MQAADGAGAQAQVLPGSGAPVRPIGGWSKRALDLVVASCALLAAAPIMLVVALIIRCTAGGPVFYSHRRIGFDGRPFYCHKFRTMARDADRALQDYLERNPEAAREWEENRKLAHDPRITLLGTMLRKSSIDELPQLLNILRGDMSCVGPRPIVADELELYGACARDYLSVRPGLTGLWQVTGRSRTDYDSRVFLDSHYVRNWSISSDLIILARTVIAVMRFDDAA